MADGPTLAQFLVWIRNYMKVPVQALPDDAPVIPLVYNFAKAKANAGIASFGGGAYSLAVYNLGGSLLIEFAPDQSGSDYFEKLRQRFKVFEFVPGVVSASSDEGTSASIAVAEALNNLTLSDLARLKDPYGRAYLAIAQQWGTNWGLT